MKTHFHQVVPHEESSVYIDQKNLNLVFRLNFYRHNFGIPCLRMHCNVTDFLYLDPFSSWYVITSHIQKSWFVCTSISSSQADTSCPWYAMTSQIQK